jgi:nitrate/nitrite transporter NarK
MQFLAVLIVAALFVKYFWVLVAGVAAAWVVRIIIRAWRQQSSEIHAARAAEYARLDGLRSRADQQHNWVMQGDPRGTYGDSESLAAPM